jgi:hypothetical protein
MTAVLQMPISRPAFDDTNLGNEGFWQLDNAAALARYWRVLGHALGLEARDGEEDLKLWLKEQHTQQMRVVARRRLPHGDSL